MTLEAKFRQRWGEFDLDFEFTAPLAGVTALFGSSGVGKSTTLRCFAGLERVLDGLLKVGETTWQDEALGIFEPPHRRAVGYVFQEPSLFPHLTVEENLRYGWKRVPEDLRKLEVEEVILWLGLESLLKRDPSSLSGGEKQRVAIGRSLLTSPDLLLMDEPLVSLDRRSKDRVLSYLEGLFRHLSIPVIYVSHSIEELARLADHLILMDRGRVQDSGPLQELLVRSDLPFAQDPEAIAMLKAEMREFAEDDGLSTLTVGEQVIFVPGKVAERGEAIRLTVAARDVSLTRVRPQETSILNVLPVTVRAVEDYDVAQVQVLLEFRGAFLLSRLTRRSAAGLSLRPGEELFAQVKSVSVR